MNKPLRVLQIMGIVGSGGVESIIMNYYHYIDKNKVQFDFVMHKGSNHHYIAEVQNMGGRIYEITPYNKNIFLFTYEIYKIIKKGHYEIIHSNMNSLSVFPLFAAWMAGAKIRILHNHTTDTKAEGLKTILKRVLRPFARLFANQYWACSKLAGVWMYGKKAVIKGKVTIINNAIDLDKFAFNQEKREILRRELGLDGKFVVGHVGRFVVAKNHDFLIDIFANVAKQKDNAMLVLIGEGPLMNSVKNKVANQRLTKEVKFLGVRNDVFNLYNIMDVFVLPSLYEGFPVVGVEVQANGLPFICSDQVTREIMISDSIELLSLKQGVEEWVKFITQIHGIARVKNKADITNLGFNIRVEAQKIESIYKNISKGR